MKWFCTKLVFQIQIESVNVSHQFDESIRMISAETIEEAYNKSYQLGIESQSSFFNLQGQQVDWKFIDVATIFEIENFSDGMEIFAVTIEETEPDRYIDALKIQTKLRELTFRKQSTLVE